MKTLRILACSVALLATGSVAAQPGPVQRALEASTRVDWIDQFLGDALDARWTPLNGSDNEAIDPYVVAGAPGGLCRLTSGDATPSATVNLSELVTHRNWTAALAGSNPEDALVFRTSVTLASTENVAFGCGWTDSVSLEVPFSISGTTVTSTATDGVVFIYDTAQTTDQWYCLAVKNDVDNAPSSGRRGNVISGVAPTAGTYQTLEIRLLSNGTAMFYIDGQHITTMVNAVTTTVALTPVFWLDSRSKAVKTATVDYCAVAVGD